MKRRKFSSTEKALLIVPLLGVILLALQGPLSSWWKHSPMNHWGTSLQRDKDTWPSGLKFSHDGRQVAALFWNSNTRKGRLDIIETATQETQQTLPLSGAGIMTWSPKNDRIVMEASNGCAVWDLKTGKRILRHLSPPNVYESVTGWQSNDVLELTYYTKRTNRYRKSRLDVNTGIFKPYGVAFTRSVPTRRYFTKKSPDERWELHVHRIAYHDFEYPKPARLRSGGSIELWDAKNQKKLRTFQGELFHHVIFTDDNSISAVTIYDPKLKGTKSENSSLYSFNDHRSKGLHHLLEKDEYTVNFSQDGRFLITTRNQKLRLRDSRTATIVHEFNTNYIEISPDGHYIAYFSTTSNSVNIARI